MKKYLTYSKEELQKNTERNLSLLVEIAEDMGFFSQQLDGTRENISDSWLKDIVEKILKVALNLKELEADSFIDKQSLIKKLEFNAIRERADMVLNTPLDI